MKKNKAKATKVTKEELKEIQTLVQNINSAQMQVGQMEIEGKFIRSYFKC